MSNNHRPIPARFSRVHAERMPEAVKVCGIVFAVGPLNSPTGKNWLPDDLLAARNIARRHLSMARDLLRFTAGTLPCDFKQLLADERETGPNGVSTFRCSETGKLTAEILCQNGVEVITALFQQLIAANEQLAADGLSNRGVTVGPVAEENAHAAAFAVAKQLANEVEQGTALSLNSEDLDRLEKLVDMEASAAAWLRAHAIENPSQIASADEPASQGGSAELPKGSAEHADGPEGGRWFWWANLRYDVPRGVVYKLLAHMWDRDSASYDDLETAKVFDSAVAPQTVRSYANKANNALPAGFPWRLSTDSVNRQLTKSYSSER